MKRVKASDLIIFFVISTLLVFSFVYIDDVKQSVISSIKSCVFTIMPSLFSVCVLSTVIIKSGILERMLSGLKINSSLLCAFILGNIGGYPIGAKILCELLKSGSISQDEAKKAICFCYCSGPAFALGIVSASVFKSKLLGTAAFFSCFAANLSLYIIYLIKNKPDFRKPARYCGMGTDIIVDAVNSSAYSMISVCSAIVFFSAVIAVLQNLISGLMSIDEIRTILEISNISGVKYSGALSFVIICLLLSFGGICVHMQVLSIVGKSFSLKSFYISRPFQLILTAVYSLLIYAVTQRYIPVGSSDSQIYLSQSRSIIPFICMTGMIFIALTCKIKPIKKLRRPSAWAEKTD